MQGECIKPTMENMHDTISFSSMMKSHNWVLDKSEGYGSTGVLTYLRCTKCGTVHVSITSRDEIPIQNYHEKNKADLVAKSS
ncbi:MAG: hypothetical protein ACYCQJ_00225 [Nitrososphaerales archaeon]